MSTYGTSATGNNWQRGHGITFLLSILILSMLISCSPPVMDSNQPDLLATISSLETQQSHQATKIVLNEEFLSYLATRVAPSPLSSVTDHPTMTPFVPFTGRVEIEGGGCCAGGIVGDTIQLQVHFYAFSQYAPVTQMRAKLGLRPFSESEMEDVEWEPYERQRTYDVVVAVNWVGTYVTFQFRDQQGNVSPVYYDDIGVEGHLASPTPE